MIRTKGLKKHRLKLIILSLITFGLFIAGPTAKWFWPSYWWGETLIVLMNENEARPCGGFVTAFGTLKLPFGGASLQNSFAFPPVDLGENRPPLRAVSLERKFWDLGDTIHLNQCAKQFTQVYEKAYDVKLQRVILVQSGVVEGWIKALGGINVKKYELDYTNFFSTTSRLVANVDRHDEVALAERKNPLSTFGKKLIQTTILRPWRWRAITRSFGAAEQNQTLYWYRPGKTKSTNWEQSSNDFVTVTEWNLGGGKSSRYLDKQWDISLRQRSPELWDLEVTLNITHLGHYDGPLSQTWKGGFELEVLSGLPQFVSAEIAPGETFTHTARFPLGDRGLRTKNDVYKLGIYTPPYQNWNTRLSLSALSQQIIATQNASLKIKENTATWNGELPPEGTLFNFKIKADTLPPFLTWHKPLSSLEVSAQKKLELQHEATDFLVEIHFNEAVKLIGRKPLMVSQKNFLFPTENLSIRLIDRDYAVKDKTENPIVKKALLLADKRTLLLNVGQSEYQRNERYYLEIDEVADIWGNTANITNRTVITR